MRVDRTRRPFGLVKVHEEPSRPPQSDKTGASASLENGPDPEVPELLLVPHSTPELCLYDVPEISRNSANTGRS